MTASTAGKPYGKPYGRQKSESCQHTSLQNNIKWRQNMGAFEGIHEPALPLLTLGSAK
jgi:hypothetical protein